MHIWEEEETGGGPSIIGSTLPGMCLCMSTAGFLIIQEGGNGGEMESYGVPVVKSRVTMQEYFAEKMRRLRESQVEEAGEEDTEEDKVEKLSKEPSRMRKNDQVERRRKRKRNRTRDRPNDK